MGLDMELNPVKRRLYKRSDKILCSAVYLLPTLNFGAKFLVKRNLGWERLATWPSKLSYWDSWRMGIFSELYPSLSGLV